MVPNEIADAELWAIGTITVQWAYLEHLLLIDTAQMANKAKIDKLPLDATSLSFKKRLSAWRLLVEETIKNARNRELRLRLASRIANTESDRHKITHGLWQWFPSNPTRLRTYSFRPPFAFADERFSFDRLLKLGERLGAINFELAYPPKRGRQQDATEVMLGEAPRSGRVSYVSRRLLLELAGKGRLNLNPLFSKPPTRMPPLSSLAESLPPA